MSDRITSKKVENGVVFDYTQHCISPSVSRKIYKLACAPIEDSDQTAHLRSLIRIFERLLGCQVSKFLQAENKASDQTVGMRKLI